MQLSILNRVFLLKVWIKCFVPFILIFSVHYIHFLNNTYIYKWYISKKNSEVRKFFKEHPEHWSKTESNIRKKIRELLIVISIYWIGKVIWFDFHNYNAGADEHPVVNLLLLHFLLLRVDWLIYTDLFINLLAFWPLNNSVEILLICCAELLYLIIKTYHSPTTYK